MRTSLHLGKIAGISIDVNWSWLIIFVLLTFSVATGWLPLASEGLPAWQYWAAAAITVLLFFASVLAHELAHSLVARMRGMPVKSITLFIFGGVSNIEREPQRPGIEFQMAFVGPLTSLVIGVVMFVAANVLAGTSTPDLVVEVLAYIGFANLALGIFNLIPGFPMDGGRVLRSIIWKATGSLTKATTWAANVGQAVAYLMILAGIWFFFSGATMDGIWIAFIGLFLLQAAQAESMQVRLRAGVEGVLVGQAMSPAPPVALPTISVQQLVDAYLLRSGQRVVPVIDNPDDQRLIGLVTLADVRKIVREQWAFVPAGAIMTPLAQLKTVQPQQPLSEALDTLIHSGVSQLPVLSDGRLVGMLRLDTILARMQLRRDLGVEAAPPEHPPVAAHTDTRLPTAS